MTDIDEIRKKHEAQRSYVLETQGDAAYLNQSIKSCLTISEVDALFKALDEAPAREKRLERIIEDQKDTIIAFEKSHAALKAENERLVKWVDDLQSGMYISCVYCGHRYGPKDKVPYTMADALKQHIETCPKHPMSALKKSLAAAEKR